MKKLLCRTRLKYGLLEPSLWKITQLSSMNRVTDFSALRKWIALLFTTLMLTLSLRAQDPTRFKEEVDKIISSVKPSKNKKLVVFTGSSSIRMWSDIASRFPNQNIINTGFGGSTMSEMFYYSQELIVDYKPEKIFIYEGDNDLATGKSQQQIIHDAEKVLNYIRGQLPKVYFISPKPSVRRWELKEKYESLNGQLQAWANAKKNVYFVDVWTPMLNEQGQVRPELYLEDNLHMNQQGYDIWSQVLSEYLK
jgi:lysophospholipase L1-like esterase